jgi:uncharacterized protein (TIGR02145 family)
MNQKSVDMENFRRTQGNMLKDKSLWEEWNKENSNRSGFSALPAGQRMTGGDFGGIGKVAVFRTNTAAFTRALEIDERGMGRYYFNPKRGLSDRCVKD